MLTPMIGTLPIGMVNETEPQPARRAVCSAEHRAFVDLLDQGSSEDETHGTFRDACVGCAMRTAISQCCLRRGIGLPRRSVLAKAGNDSGPASIRDCAEASRNAHAFRSADATTYVAMCSGLVGKNAGPGWRSAAAAEPAGDKKNEQDGG